MAETLAANALVNLSTVKDELGIGVSTYDDVLTRRINWASQAIADYCNRKRFGFVFAGIGQYIGVPGARGPRITLDLTPVASLARIELDANPGPPDVLPATQYQLEDPVRGWVYNDSRWVPTALRDLGIVQDWQPGTEKKTLLASYVGGYVTQPQLDAAASAHWPGAATSASLGTIITPSAHATQCWAATGLDASVQTGLSGATGGGEPVWGASPTRGATLADGTLVWTYLGTAAQAKSIPAALEMACLKTVETYYLRRGQTTDIQSESLGRASASYGRRSVLPPEAEDALKPYVRKAVAFA